MNTKIIEFLQQQQEIQSELLRLLQSEQQQSVKSSDADDLGTGFVDPAMIARRDRVHLNIAQEEVTYADGSRVVSCWFYRDESGSKYPVLVDAINGYIEEVSVKYSSDLVEKIEDLKDPYRLHVYLRLDENKLVPENFPDVPVVVLNAGATSHFAKQFLVALRNFNKGDRISVCVSPGTRSVIHAHFYDGSRHLVRITWNDVKAEFGGKKWNSQWKALEAEIVDKFGGFNDRCVADIEGEGEQPFQAQVFSSSSQRSNEDENFQRNEDEKPQSQLQRPHNQEFAHLMADVIEIFGLEGSAVENVILQVVGEVVQPEELSSSEFIEVLHHLMVDWAVYQRDARVSLQDAKIFYSQMVAKEGSFTIDELTRRWDEHISSLAMAF
jgi:hypothetical protein